MTLRGSDAQNVELSPLLVFQLVQTWNCRQFYSPMRSGSKLPFGCVRSVQYEEVVMQYEEVVAEHCAAMEEIASLASNIERCRTVWCVLR